MRIRRIKEELYFEGIYLYPDDMILIEDDKATIFYIDERSKKIRIYERRILDKCQIEKLKEISSDENYK